MCDLPRMHVHVHGHVHGDVDGHCWSLSVVGGAGSQVLAVVLGRVAVRRRSRVVTASRARWVDDRVLQGEQHVGHALAVHVAGPRHALTPRASPTVLGVITLSLVNL